MEGPFSHTERRPRSLAAIPLLVAAGIYVLLLGVGKGLLNDPDTYWHIAVGRWIAAHGAVPRVDPFSFTMHGAHWIAFEWLSELIYAATFAVSGWPGVFALAAAAIAAAFGLLTRFLLREWPAVPAVLAAMVAFVLAAPHMLARPHTLVLPIMVAWTAALVRAMDERSGPPYRALPLLLVWANLHGSVILAIGLIGPAVLETLLRERDAAGWARVLRQWLPFAALAIVVSCLTPYGPGSMLVPLTTYGLGDALNTIQEWRPRDFSHLGAFEILLLLAIFALTRGVRLPVVRTLVVLGLLHLSLSQSRNVDLLAMLAPLYLARPLGPGFRAHERDAVSAAGRVPRVAVPLAALLMILATGLGFARHLAPNPLITPKAAVEATDLPRSEPVFNDYTFGGYLIFVGIPTFIDGRGELYGAQFINRWYRAMMLSDLPDFEKLLDEYHIRSTLLTPKTPAVALLDRLPGWERAYADDVAVVHKRRDIAH